MNASAFAASLRFAMVLGAAALCGACGSLDAIWPSWAGGKATTVASKKSGDVPESEKLLKLPLSAEDLDCPTVDLEDGASSLRVGGPDNASVRYQFEIAQTARECEPEGDKFSLKVGVSGRLLIGPAGSPGAYSAPLRLTVRNEADHKPAYSKTYTLNVDTAGAVQAPFSFVSEPIVLPMTRTDLADDYSITVGLGAEKAATPAASKPPKPHKPRPTKTPAPTKTAAPD